MGPPRESLLKQTIELWQTRTERIVSEEDARGSIENVAGFFDLLERWERSNPPGEAHTKMGAA
jgi:hypothetical protein